jgi:DNA polymerase-1
MSTIIVDGHSIAYRIFYKVPPLTNSRGEPTGLVHSFVNSILSIKEKFNPENFYVTFDAKGETERHKVLKEYKANRPATPEALISQIEYIKKILPLLGIDVYCMESVEADDIIYTLASKENKEVFLVTKDKDLMQLVDDRVKILDYQTGEILSREDIKKKIGVYPEQILDFLALCGDTSDNIPGVKGVGPKTAIKLLDEFKNIEELYENIDTLKGSLREKLIESKDLAFLSKKLATLKVIENIHKLEPDDEDLEEILKGLELKSLYKRIFSKEEKSEKSVAFTEKFLFFVNKEIFLFDGKGLSCIEKLPNASFNYVYDVKNIYKKTSFYSDEIYDLLLISWLNNPDSGGIKLAKGEDIESFANRVINKTKVEIELCKENELLDIYFKYELPLTKVIATMENNGIKLDKDVLEKINDEIEKEVKEIEEWIYETIGERININSPKQLREVLFDILKLTPFKKTKTGYSTDEESLRNMVIVNPEHRDLLEKIIEYRELTKLVSTYTSKLPDYIDKKTGRIHSEFDQTGTATGRFSSSDPNLQNIPLKGEWGKKVRSAFVAEDKNSFISIDYSQIELRFLAHFSKDPTLIKAFNDGLDIHKITGSKIFKIPEEKVEGDLRRIAKAVNFGILYGLSPFGLARDTGVTQSDAKVFIDTYFKTYPKVKEFIDSVIKEARVKGYTKTILGRKRFFPEINSNNFVIRNRSERMAVNSILQGSAADVIKLAMLKSQSYLEENLIDGMLVLQIHDELVFEVKDDIVDKVIEDITEIMENLLELNVKLEVNSSYAKNLSEMK